MHSTLKTTNMKKAILTSAILLYLLPASGQIAKGTHTFGMNLSFNSSSNSTGDLDGDFSSAYVYPRAGLLLSDRFELGLGLSYAFNNSTYNYTGTNPEKSEQNEHVYSFLPYLKYYMPVSEKFYFDLLFLAGIGFGSRTEEQTMADYHADYSITQFRASLYPQFSYMFSKHWAIDFGLGYLNFQSTTYKDKETSEKNTTKFFNLNAAFAGGMSLGATYYF